MARVSPDNWIAVECTGGFIVDISENKLYYQGFTFKNPKNYQKFLELEDDWINQYQDYEDYRLYYNGLVDDYNNASPDRQQYLKSGLDVAKKNLDEKEHKFLETDSALSTLIQYG